MGQKNSRIENSTFETEIGMTKESLVHDNGETSDISLKKSDNSQNNYKKNLSLRTNEKKVTQFLKKNASETFSSGSTHYRWQSNAGSEKIINTSRMQARKPLPNNFYVFLDKNNSYFSNMGQNRSASYYIPELEIKRNDSKSELDNFRSKSISEINESASSKLDTNNIDTFSELEIKTIKMTYNFIKNDLNSVGVIAFMKSFETLPDIQNKFDAFKFLPIDEVSKSHALRTHSKKVMNIIDQFVDALENDQLDQMKKKLFLLGERHHIYRAKKEYFSIIEYQFINAIRPIINKNLQVIQKSQLIEINEDFSFTFDDRFFNSSEDDLYIESYLNNDEIGRAFDLIKLIWQKLFEIIRFYMDLGMDSFESKIKS